MRTPSAILAVLLMTIMSVSPATAQETTPDASGSLLAAFGYPELRITVTADAVDAPTEVAADRYLVVVDNQTDGYVQASFIQLPEGVTLEPALAAAESGEEEAAPAWYDRYAVARPAESRDRLRGRG
jgi:hypothetical protein